MIRHTYRKRTGVAGKPGIASEDNPKLAVDEALETIKHWRLSLFFGFTVFKFYL